MKSWPMREVTAFNGVPDKRRKRRRRKMRREVRQERKRERERREGGREALRFFRRRDFETCLSALKSREIKEPRPKLGEHVQGRPGKTRRKQWLPKGRGAEGGVRNTRRMGRQAKREVRQKVVRRSYTYRDSSRSFVPSILILLVLHLPPSYSFFLFYRRSAVASFDVPPWGMCHTQGDLRTELYSARLIYRLVSRAISIVSIVSSIAS